MTVEATQQAEPTPVAAPVATKAKAPAEAPSAAPKKMTDEEMKADARNFLAQLEQDGEGKAEPKEEEAKAEEGTEEADEDAKEDAEETPEEKKQGKKSGHARMKAKVEHLQRERDEAIGTLQKLQAERSQWAAENEEWSHAFQALKAENQKIREMMAEYGIDADPKDLKIRQLEFEREREKREFQRMQQEWEATKQRQERLAQAQRVQPLVQEVRAVAQEYQIDERAFREELMRHVLATPEGGDLPDLRKVAGRVRLYEDQERRQAGANAVKAQAALSSQAPRGPGGRTPPANYDDDPMSYLRSRGHEV